MKPSEDFRKRMMEGYGLATVQVIFPYPDYPSVLAPPFEWQTLDIAPGFPRIRRFLEHWRKKIVVQPVHIFVFHSRLITPTEIRIAGEFRLN